MDKLDFDIIGLLDTNSRMPFMEISRRLKVSESTIRKRVANLESTGIIKKYSLAVDNGKAGIGHIALIGVDVAPERYLDVAEKLTEFKEVKYAAITTGDHMFMLEVLAKNDDELRAFSSKLRGIDGVTRICPAIVKDILKGTL